MNRALLLVLMVPMLAMLGVGCRKEICHRSHPHAQPVAVSVDWSGVYDGKVPAMIGINFYPMILSKADQKYVPVEVVSPITVYLPAEGGTINLPVGTYSAVAYNLDMERVQLRNHNSLELLEAYTLAETRKRSQGGDSSVELTVQMPDALYTHNVELLHVVAEKNDRTSQSLQLSPRTVVTRFWINAKVQGLQYAADYRGALSNMRGGYFVGLQQASDQVVTVLYKMEKVSDEYVRAEVMTFGVMPTDQGVRNVITLDFLMRDGKILSFPFDVSEQMAELIDDQQITLGLDSPIVLPPNDSDDEGGFGGGIGGWEDEVVVPL